jgi:thiopurine S-methyltransferase
LSAAAATSVAGAAATFALARSVNAAVKTRQPSSLLPEGTGGAGSAGEAVSGSYAATDAASVPGEDALPPVDADAHRRNAEAWRRKWENAYALDDRGASRATLANPPGFHHANVHPLLRKHKMALLGAGVTSPPEPSRRVFVPLCGASPDLLWLAACGHRVVGVELSGAAARGFFDEKGLPRATSAAGGVPVRHTGGIERVHVSGNVAIVEGDLFSLDADARRRIAEANRGDVPEPDLFGEREPSEKRLARDAVATLRRRLTGGAVTKSVTRHASDPEVSYAADARVGARHSISFTEECLRFAAGGGPAMDAVWDRGALVAVAPDMRRRYARVIAARMAPGGRMLLVATSYDVVTNSLAEGTAPPGPPFSVPEREVRSLYEPLGLTVRELGSEECLETAPPRMRERLASMRETVYLVEKPRQQRKRR